MGAEIRWNANPEEVREALVQLETIRDVTVTFDDYTMGTTTACAEVNPVVISVTFTQELGDVPKLKAYFSGLTLTPDPPPVSPVFASMDRFADGEWVAPPCVDTVDQTCPSQTPGVPGPLNFTSAMGTMENEECSNRGICNRQEGTCACFQGYASSNGNNGPGTRGDCGWKTPYSITAQ